METDGTGARLAMHPRLWVPHPSPLRAAKKIYVDVSSCRHRAGPTGSVLRPLIGSAATLLVQSAVLRCARQPQSRVLGTGRPTQPNPRVSGGLPRGWRWLLPEPMTCHARAVCCAEIVSKLSPLEATFPSVEAQNAFRNCAETSRFAPGAQIPPALIDHVAKAGRPPHPEPHF